MVMSNKIKIVLSTIVFFMVSGIPFLRGQQDKRIFDEGSPEKQLLIKTDGTTSFYNRVHACFNNTSQLPSNVLDTSIKVILNDALWQTLAANCTNKRISAFKVNLPPLPTGFVDQPSQNSKIPVTGDYKKIVLYYITAAYMLVAKNLSHTHQTWKTFFSQTQNCTAYVNVLRGAVQAVAYWQNVFDDGYWVQVAQSLANVCSQAKPLPADAIIDGDFDTLYVHELNKTVNQLKFWAKVSVATLFIVHGLTALAEHCVPHYHSNLSSNLSAAFVADVTVALMIAGTAKTVSFITRKLFGR